MKTKEHKALPTAMLDSIRRKREGMKVCASVLSALFMLTVALPGVALFSVIPVAFAASETSLFDSQGVPRAYIAPDLTIYLWSGEPTAYLHESGATVHVYGFNGKHMGWLVNGNILFNHQGYAVCATKDGFRGFTQFEPFKSFKQFKPLKSLKELPPLRPLFSRTWSDLPCAIFLKQGI